MQNGASSCQIGSEIQTSSMASDGQTANHHFHGKKTINYLQTRDFHIGYPHVFPRNYASTA